MMDVLSLAENVQEIPTLIPASVPAGGARHQRRIGT